MEEGTPTLGKDAASMALHALQAEATLLSE